MNFLLYAWMYLFFAIERAVTPLALRELPSADVLVVLFEAAVFPINDFF